MSEIEKDRQCYQRDNAQNYHSDNRSGKNGRLVIKFFVLVNRLLHDLPNPLFIRLRADFPGLFGDSVNVFFEVSEPCLLIIRASLLSRHTSPSLFYVK